MPSLLHELAVDRGDGSYARLLVRLTRFDLLAIDDWMLVPLRGAERRDLTEIIGDRAERASTLIASQSARHRLARRHRRPRPSRALRQLLAVQKQRLLDNLLGELLRLCKARGKP